MNVTPIASRASSSSISRSSTPLSLTPSGTDAEQMPLRSSVRRTVDRTGWRASSELEGLTAIGAGLALSAVPLAMACSDRAIRLLAPGTSQVLTTVGATVAGFSHVSELRKVGGDPHGYGLWRAGGFGTAVATPLLGAMVSHSLDIDAFDPSLFFGCIVSGALLVSSGMWLQTLFDLPAARREELQRIEGARYAAAIAMAAAIGWQATTLSVDTYRRVQQGGGLLPDGIDGRAVGTVAVSIGTLMTISGFAVGLHARHHGHEPLRVAALTIGITGLTAAIAGAGLFASSPSA